MTMAIQTSSSLVMTKYFVCLFSKWKRQTQQQRQEKEVLRSTTMAPVFFTSFQSTNFSLERMEVKKEVEVVICQFPRRVISTVHFTDQYLIFIFNDFWSKRLIFEVIIEEAFYHNGFFGIFTFTSNVGLCYKTWPRATPPLFADTSVKKIISIFNPFSWAKCWARFTYQCRAETGSVEMEK